MGTQVGLNGAPMAGLSGRPLYTLSTQGDAEGPSRVRPATASPSPTLRPCLSRFPGLEDGETFDLQEARGNTRSQFNNPARHPW